MKKHFGILLSILSLFIMPLISFADWQIYEGKLVVTDPPIKNAVCMSHDAGKMFFSSIEKGLNYLNNREGLQVLYVLPGQTVTIKEDVTIGENVALYIPFGYDDKNACTFSEKQWMKVVEGYKTPIDTSIENINKYRKTKVILDEGVKLTLEHKSGTNPHSYENGGKLIIGGTYGEIGVLGNYSELLLKKNATILNRGTIECYGYIKEDYDKNINDSNDLRQILNDRGQITVPMAIYDFPINGTDIENIYNNGICMFNSFDFPTIQTKMHFDSYCDFLAKVHIERKGQKINSQFSVINSDASKDALFRYDSGDSRNSFKLDVEYKNLNENDLKYGFTSGAASKNIYTQYDIYGKVNIGYIKINVYDDYDIDTSSMILPLSYRMHINVKSGSTFGLGYPIKCMPGNRFEIEMGSTVILTNFLSVYEKKYQAKMNAQRYPGDFDTAEFYVNGTLYMADTAHIGGRLLTTDRTGGASLDFTDITSSENFFAESKEGKIASNICNQAYGIIYKPAGTIAQNGITEAVCHFKNGMRIYSTIGDSYMNGNKVSGWKLKGMKDNREVEVVYIPLMYKINIGENANYENTCYAYEVYKQIAGKDGSMAKTIEIFPDDKELTLYVNINEYIKLNVRRNSQVNSKTASFAFQNYTYQSLRTDVSIEIIPSKAYKLSITEDKVADPSGRGSVVTYVYETTSTANPIPKDHFYLIITCGGAFDAGVTYNIPAGGHLCIETSYPRWKYRKETIQVGNNNPVAYHGPDHAERAKPIKITGDITLRRYGGSAF